MSFALDYRQKMQAEARRAQQREEALEQANTGFVVLPASAEEDTRGNRRRVLAALSLAAIILSVFNSGGMVQYSGGLAATWLGTRIILATESWHRLMEENHMTVVVEEIRSVVSEARAASWPELKLGSTREAIRPRDEAPVRSRPLPSYMPREKQPANPKPRPRGPVMKASAEPR